MHNRIHHRLVNSVLLFSVSAAVLLMRPGVAMADPVRVMPLGDSITSSLNGNSSYRYWLWNYLQTAGMEVDFVGSLWGVGNGQSGTYGDFDQDHEGHSGATTDFVLFGVDYWMARSQPDVVLLLIGGNDLDEGASPASALENSREIIERIRQARPDVAILWAMIPPAPHLKSKYKAYNSGVAKYSRKLSTRNSPVRAVNLWSGFNPFRDTLDGDHPNELGEQKIARKFYTSLRIVLRQLQRR